jgi:hypothetical protein
VNDLGRHLEVETSPPAVRIGSHAAGSLSKIPDPGGRGDCVNLTLAYRSRSAVVSTTAGLAVSLAPNLRRDRVSFDGTLSDPLLFREAMGALHDIVVSDLRFKPRDRSDYLAFKAERERNEAALHQVVAKQTRAAIEASMPELPEAYPADLDVRYRSLRKQYWKARLTYSSYLARHDPELWRILVPCDPVITVAADCLFFECFSADESSYGCLTVDREAFGNVHEVALGTTNVDYSWTLYEHFQSMRSYRETRFLVDPSGFEVRSDATSAVREEKIDLPPSWLRGFLQLQAAMSSPLRRVSIDRGGLYNILAHLKRHRAARSPRAIRFELEAGHVAHAILEPWEERIRLGDERYAGPRSETIRVWGRDRLQVLSRLLPVMDGAEVYLLGSGLPSFWSVRVGPIRLLLGLSGWTVNDWTRAGALDQIAPPAEPDPVTLDAIARAFHAETSLSFDRLLAITRSAPPALAAGLNRLALLGQVIHDLPLGLYRWRQIMPVTLSAELIGPDHPETKAARVLVAARTVKVSHDQSRPDGSRVIEGRSGSTNVSILVDCDGRMVRGQCTCSHHFKGGLRRGPCRHLQALRIAADANKTERATLASWYAALWN